MGNLSSLFLKGFGFVMTCSKTSWAVISCSAAHSEASLAGYVYAKGSLLLTLEVTTVVCISKTSFTCLYSVLSRSIYLANKSWGLAVRSCLEPCLQ